MDNVCARSGKIRFKAALIDMDGVLYDSMPFHAKAWHAMFSEQGVHTDPEEFFLYEGMTGAATINLIFQREKGREATETEKKDLYDRKAMFFKSFGRKGLIPGALDVLETLKGAGLNTVLVTGSAQNSLLNILDNDYPGFFPPQRRVTAFDVKKGKPDPEPYLKGAQKARVKPGECMVIENAPLGVRAAKAAGCFTVAVMTGPIPRKEFEKEGADLIFPSMNELNEYLNNTLLNGDEG